MTRIFTLLAYFINCVNIMAQNNDVFPDTMRLKVDNGKVVKIPLTYSDDNCKCYSTYEKFVEHDTTFLYREYSYFRENPSKPFGTYATSYYIIPRSHKGYFDTLNNKMGARNSRVRAGYITRILTDIMEQMPNLEKQQLGDIPRVWHPLWKQGGAYYYTDEIANEFEFTDMLLMHYCMETWFRPLKDFRKLDGGGWAYKTVNDEKKGEQVTIIPCSKLKGAYIMTSIVEGEQPEYSLLTNDKEIVNFDLIRYESYDHEPEGLDYEEIDFDSLR